MEREGLVRLAKEREMRAAALAAVAREPGHRAPADRLADILDAGTLFEVSAMATSQIADLREVTPTDGVVAGFGQLQGAELAVIADDAAIIPRTDGTVGRNKRLRVLMHAVQGRVPLLYLADGGGLHRFDLDLGEGRLLGRYTDRSIVMPELELSERTAPIVSLLLGPVAGQEAALVAGSDVVVATPDGRIGSGPGSAGAPFCDVAAANEAEAIGLAKRILALLPAQRQAALPPAPAAGPSAELPDAPGNDLPAESILAGLFDAGTFIAWAGTPVLKAGLGRIAGFPVACALGDEGAAGLAEGEFVVLARLASLCNRLALPLLLIQNGAAYDRVAASRPGFLRALTQTTAALHDGEAPKVTLITRRGHALGDFVLGGRELGTYLVLAWPLADVGLDDVPAFDTTEAKRIAGRGPWDASGLAIVDDLVEPRETRARLAAMLPLLLRSRDYPKPHTERAGRIPYR